MGKSNKKTKPILEYEDESASASGSGSSSDSESSSESDSSRSPSPVRHAREYILDGNLQIFITLNLSYELTLN